MTLKKKKKKNTNDLINYHRRLLGFAFIFFQREYLEQLSYQSVKLVLLQNVIFATEWVKKSFCACRGYRKPLFIFFFDKLYLIFPHLLYLHLCFTREDCCYDNSIFLLHGVSILEDLVITLADGIASIFLELISVDGNLSNEMNSLGLALCTLSTRALQRLRNEVVFVSLE